MNALTLGSLFSGIGAFDLGLERAGMRVLWQCENERYAQRVLAKHWPDVLRVPDVRDVGRSTVPRVDVLCGGFPCQDLSYAGKGAGLEGERSGLWSEFARIIRELRPRYVIVENVPALLARGLDVVLGDLAALGLDAEWDCLPASAFGAPHRRDRIWIVAYPNGERGEWSGARLEGRDEPADGGSDVAYANGQGVEGHGRPVEGAGERSARSSGAATGGFDGYADHWRVEPGVGRVAPRAPHRVDRLRCLGNSLVPQIAEYIGQRIVAYEEAGEQAVMRDLERMADEILERRPA